jgi:hypothetical protein
MTAIASNTAGATEAFEVVAHVAQLDAGDRAVPDLFAFLMAFPFVLLHHGSRGDFFGPLAVASRPLRALLDVFVLALLLAAHASKMFSPGHVLPPSDELIELEE